jgi:outer membrane receptor protein involved in Fe transport
VIDFLLVHDIFFYLKILKYSKMKRIIFSLIFSFAVNIAFSQVIKGKLFDALTKEPIVGASIKLANPNKTFFTNNEGGFTLPNTGRDVTAFITALGYISVEFNLSNTQGNLIALESSSDYLQEVVVTANRDASLRTQAPIAINRISPKTMDETKATSVYEVINKVPGVMMVNYNNEQHAMSIRQPMATSNYYLYMEDGIPIRPMGVFNHNALLELNQFTVSSIEVVKGPVSSIYGPEAVGGAINFISQRPTSVPTGKVGIQFDQFGYKRIQLGSGVKFGKFGFYIGGLFSDQTNSWMASSDYKKSSFNSRLEYHFNDKTRLIGTISYADYNSETAGSVDSISFFSRSYQSTSDFTYRKSNANRNRITLEHDWNKSSKSYVTIFNRFNKHGQNPSYGIRWTSGQSTARGEVNSNDFSSYGVIAQHTQTFKFLKSKLLTGGMFDYSPNTYWSHQVDLNAQLRLGGKSVEKFTILKERPDIKLADYDAIIRNSAIYTQYDLELIEDLRLSLGLRYDLMSFTYDNYLDNSKGSKRYQKITPKLGLTYDLGHDIGIYANISQGFAPPGLTAVFRKKPNTNPAEFYYNLSPATFNNYELGSWASLFQNRLYLEASLYRMDGKNELLNIRQADNSFDYQSAGKTLHQGIEYSLSFKPSDEFSFRFGGTSALHRFEDFLVSIKSSDALKKLDGFEMPISPRTTFNTEFSYYPKWIKNFRTSLELQHADEWYQNQVNTIKYEGYNVLNMRFGYKVKGIEIFSNLMNINNALYATNASRGNNLTDRSTFTPSAPRTIVMGLQYNITGRK